MKFSHPFIYLLLIGGLALTGCVPASQTIAVLDQQTNEARSKHAFEMNDQKQLLRDRRKLESELATNSSRIRQLQAGDPNAADSSAQAEIRRLERQNSVLNRQIASAF